MIHFNTKDEYTQLITNILIYLWDDLDMCLEYIYELVLVLINCIKDNTDELNYYKEYQVYNDLVDLSDTYVDDITFLEGMTNITSLDISITDIKDASSLSGLINLEELILSRTNINNIDSLYFKKDASV